MRGVGILGSILTFQSNGLFIGQTNSGTARERGKRIQCLWPVVVSIEECTSGCCDKDRVEGLQARLVRDTRDLTCQCAHTHTGG